MSPRHFFFTMNFDETAFKYQNGLMNFFTITVITKNVLLGDFSPRLLFVKPLLVQLLLVHKHLKKWFWESLSLIQSFIILKLFSSGPIEFDIQIRLMATGLRSNLQNTTIMHINMHCSKVNIESILNSQIPAMPNFNFL